VANGHLLFVVLLKSFLDISSSNVLGENVENQPEKMIYMVAKGAAWKCFLVERPFVEGWEAVSGLSINRSPDTEQPKTNGLAETRRIHRHEANEFPPCM
jgi:hypothetical protein